MNLPMGAIHLLDRLQFRFHEDYRIDERLLDDFLRVGSTHEAMVSVLSHLESQLDARHGMVWIKTKGADFEFFASTDEANFRPGGLPESMNQQSHIRWIRHEPLSKDWESTQVSLFGRMDERIKAIDVLYEPLFCLIVAWGDTIPAGDALESALRLIQAGFDLDRVPRELRRTVRTPYGKTYLLAPILALHRFHDPDTAKHQEEAASFVDRLLSKHPALAEQVKTFLWIKDVGAVLTPKRILAKTKRTKEETELVLEAVEGTRDLLALFHLEENLLVFSSFENEGARTLLPEDVAFAEAAWRLTDRKSSVLRTKLPRSLMRRFPASVQTRIKQSRSL